MISVNNQNPINERVIPTLQNLSSVDREYVQNLHDRLTMFGEIPYSIPVPMIVEVIKSSAKFFYEYFSGSWYQTYFLIEYKELKQYINKSNGEQTLALRVSPKIQIIKKVWESGNNSKYSIDKNMGDFDYAYFDTMQSGGQSFYQIDKHLVTIEYATKMSELSAMNAIFTVPLPTKFNQAANILVFNKVPKGNIIIDCMANIPVYNLYKNSFFDRHVIANVKRELKRKIGGHTFELVGGTTINGEEICNNIEDAEKVEDLIKAGSGMGDIILKRGN